MFVTVDARTPCLLCGYLLSVSMCGDLRVNKRSARFSATLGFWKYTECPECLAPVPRSGASLTSMVLRHADAVKVAEYRLRKWGVAVNEAARERAAG